MASSGSASSKEYERPVRGIVRRGPGWTWPRFDHANRQWVPRGQRATINGRARRGTQKIRVSPGPCPPRPSPPPRHTGRSMFRRCVHGEASVIHRECGVLKTTYEADMALYPLPISRWTVAALAVLFLLVLPFSVHEYRS